MIWPIKGTITQRFGRPAMRVEPTMFLERDAEGWKRCKPTAFAGGVKFEDVHPGTDISCPIGTPVKAPADGVLLRRETYRIYNPLTSKYVYALSIYFRFGTKIMYVDHLSAYVAKEGQKVAAGGLLARTGNSGISTGPHAHMEVRASTDPHASWSAFRLNPERVLK